MKKLIVVFAIVAVCGTRAQATNLLVSYGRDSNGYQTRGLGTYDWHDANTLLNQNGQITPTYVDTLENNAQVMSADAIWINDRWTSGRLSTAEMNNLSQFVATGRKVVFIGENNWWEGWNDQFLSLFGVRTDPTQHYWFSVTPQVQSTLTAGITTLDITEGGVPLGGSPVFTDGVVSLFGPAQNVLAVLDSNVYEGNLYASGSIGAGQQQFAINTFQWLAQVPEPGEVNLLLCGLTLIVYVRCSAIGKKTRSPTN